MTGIKAGITRRSVAAGLGAAGLGAVAAAPAVIARAQATYPDKPIKLIVPFPPGGGSDYMARLIGPKITDSLKQPFIVDNKPGAAATIGADAAAKAAPDGYTLLMVVRDMGINPSIYKELPYDTLKSFSWICKVADGPYVIVANPSFQAKTVVDLVTMAKAKPGSISYGSLGIGTMGHINVEALKQALGIDLLHVPYKGAGPALAATVQGEVQVSIAAFTGALPHVRDGKLRALAVGSEQRSKHFPDVPTIAEIGGGTNTVLPTFWGFAAPTGTPRPIIDKLNAEFKRVFALPDVIEKLEQSGLFSTHSTPEELGTVMEKDVAHFARLVKSIGIEPQ